MLQCHLLAGFGWSQMQKNISKHVILCVPCLFASTTTEALSENCSYLCVKPSEHTAVCLLAPCLVSDSHTSAVTAAIVVKPGRESRQDGHCEAGVTQHQHCGTFICKMHHITLNVKVIATFLCALFFMSFCLEHF